jgi:hypothetical protein
MWEVEGRSTEEIAAELGIKPSAVRHTVSRARASLRRILSELIIDEERGLTALDLLSTTYKKASAVAQKSSKVALSLILVLGAFLGFNSITGNNSPIATPQNTEIASGPLAGSSSGDSGVVTPGDVIPSAAKTETGIDSTQKATVVVVSIKKPAASATPIQVVSTPEQKTESLFNGFALKSAHLTFPGLDKEGLPVGYTITDSTNTLGKLYVGKDPGLVTSTGVLLSSRAMTTVNGPNILLSQVITVDGSGTTYTTTAAAGVNGFWTPLNIGSTTVNTERLPDGDYLMTVTLLIDSSISSDFLLATNSRGYDLTAAPKAITARLLLTPGKTQILAEAISVSESRKGATA